MTTAAIPNITIEQNLIYTTAVNGIGTGATFVGSNVIAQHNTVLTIPGYGYHTTYVTLPGEGNISNAGGQLNLQYTDPNAPNYYNSVYQNATVGLGATIEDFRPVPGGPADFGSGLGAEQRIAELLAEGGGTPGNSAPDAGNDAVAVVEDSAVTVSASELLSNDSDPDGDAIAITGVSNGAHGTAVLNADGSITYTPDADFFGEDIFSYTLTDSDGRSDTATVTVSVGNTPDAPTAENDAVYASPDQAKVIDVIGNDSDPDGDDLQITGVTQGANGSVTINGDGTVTYTANAPAAGGTLQATTQSAGMPETDSFTYTVSDGNGGTDTATVTVTFGSLPAPVLDLSGSHQFDGTASDVINLPHQESFEIEQGTIAFSFTANDVSSRQGLLTKDAYSYTGGGNHLAIYIQDGVLHARFQDGQAESILTFGGLVGGHRVRGRGDLRAGVAYSSMWMANWSARTRA